jgi:hypothetical protein
MLCFVYNLSKGGGNMLGCILTSLTILWGLATNKNKILASTTVLRRIQLSENYSNSSAKNH